MMAMFIYILLTLLSPSCKHEEPAGMCHWDATTQGNNQGDSFVTFPLGDHQVVISINGTVDVY